MEINRAATQLTPVYNSTKQKGDSPTELQKLEQQGKDIQKELKQLEQDKQGGDFIKVAKNDLSKQMKEIDQKIKVLKQQETAQVSKAEDGKNARPPRFDEYIKSDQEISGVGIYSMEKDEKGNPIIAFTSPDKVPEEDHEPIKPLLQAEKPEMGKCTVNTDRVDAEIKKLQEKLAEIQQKVEQAKSPEEKAELERQLAKVEMELQAKDNDAYRKQNSTYTYHD